MKTYIEPAERGYGSAGSNRGIGIRGYQYESRDSGITGVSLCQFTLMNPNNRHNPRIIL